MQWFHRRSTKCGRGRGRRRRKNSARISHPPPFRRVTKNGRVRTLKIVKEHNARNGISGFVQETRHNKSAKWHCGRHTLICKKY